MILELLEKGENIPNPERFTDQEWIKDLDKLVTEAEDKSEYARQHRNWRIAHLDFGTIMGKKTLKPLDIEEVKLIIDSIFRAIRYVHSGMFPDTDLLDTVSYQSGAGHYMAREKLRIHFLTYLDKLIDPKHESDPYSDEHAASFYNRFNVDLNEMDQESLWPHIWLYCDYRKEAKDLRDKGITGSTDRWP